MSQVMAAQPVIKRKAFSYRTQMEWLEHRSGKLESDEKQALRVSSPPEFQGEKGLWTPEDLYVGAVNACTMSTFLAYAEKKQLKVLSYESKAEGVLEFAGGKYWFTQIKVQPVIVVASIEAAALAEHLLHEAHTNCFLTNSIKSNVILEPQIKILEI